jgi:hypothetical protein
MSPFLEAVVYPGITLLVAGNQTVYGAKLYVT